MRILVYPHAMELGGSQLNAVELAAAVRDLGHDVVVYCEDGPLVERVEALQLPRLERVSARRTPSPRRAADLATLARKRSLDILHGYEWPPILETYAGAVSSDCAVVGTVMSMSVAPFLPSTVPLVVGTERIKSSIRERDGSVTVIEPPVDTAANRPSLDGAAFRRHVPGPRGALRVVVVSRLVAEMKLEGILTLIKVTRLMAEEAQDPVIHLTIVGDGPAMPEVRAAAELANRATARMHGADIVTLTGELSDPRPAYAAADIAVGMGGSALRSLAFGKPLIVQGEGGFFEVLDPTTLPCFLDQGFFGQAHLDPAEAGVRLRSLLHGLARDDERREQLGSWGRELVQKRFSLTAAAERQAEVYRRAVQSPMSRTRWLAGGLRAAPGLAQHQVSRRLDRRRGKEVRDDFNSRPV